LMGIFVIPSIVSILFPEYPQSAELIPIISLSIIPGTIASLYYAQLMAHEKSGILVISSVSSTIILITGILSLGSLFGVIGLAYSFVLSSLFRMLFLFLISFNEKKSNNS